MASLVSLPTEIKDEIFTQLSQGDLASMSGTCKDIYSSMVPMLYSNIVVSHEIEPTETVLPIMALLRTILDKPGYGMYIHEIEFRSITPEACNLRCGEREKPIVQSPRPGCKNKQLVERAVNGLPFPNRECWYEAALWNNEPDAMIAIILAQSMNLRSLTIDAAFLTHKMKCLPIIFRHLLSSQEEANRSFSFDQLVRFRVTNSQGYDVFDRMSIESYLFPYYFPKIANLHLNCAPSHKEWGESDPITRPLWPLPEAPTANNLTTLQLVELTANADTIEFLLKHTPNLRSLVLDCTLPTSDSPFNLSTLRQGLYHVRSTLANLRFTFRYEANVAADPESMVNVLRGSLIPLRDLTVLENLEISLSLLYGQIESQNLVPLADVLPPELTRLVLNEDLLGYDSFYFTWLWKDVISLYKTYVSGDWKIANPHLQELELESKIRYWDHDENVDLTPNFQRQIHQLCKSQGLEYTMKGKCYL